MGIIDDYMAAQRQVVIPEDVLKRLVMYRENHKRLLEGAERLMRELRSQVERLGKAGDEITEESLKRLQTKSNTIRGYLDSNDRTLAKELADIESGHVGMWWDFESRTQFNAYLKTVIWDDVERKIAQLEEYQLGAEDKARLARYDAEAARKF